MLRRNFMLTARHVKWLDEEAKAKGVSMSEVLRAAIDAYFVGKEGK
jgi:hypothetical protein